MLMKLKQRKIKVTCDKKKLQHIRTTYTKNMVAMLEPGFRLISIKYTDY